MNAVLSRSGLSILIFQYLLFAFSVEMMAPSPSEKVHAFITERGVQISLVIAFDLQ